MIVPERYEYDFLLEYFLRANVYGVMADFNKQYFPDDYKKMKERLERLIEELPLKSEAV